MPSSGRLAFFISSQILDSGQPSNTGVAACSPRIRQAMPRCVSSTCPTFMRDGTPSGFSTMSTGVPSGMKGMSSSGRMRATTPLLPWRPDILSPTLSFFLLAM